MGERNHKLNEVATAVKEALVSTDVADNHLSVLTHGGTMQVRWDE